MAEQITLDPAEVAEGALFPPSVRAVGAVANGTGNITPGLPAGTAEYDILLMPVETAAQTVNVPADWAHVTGSPVTEGANTRLSVLWKRATASESAPTLTDPGDHQVARIVGIQDATRAGYPFEAETTGTEATSDTSASIPGNTALLNGPNRLIFAALSTGASVASTAQATSWANANATTVTERVDNWVTDGNGGGIAAATFVLEYGMRFYPATTATLSTASSKALMSLAVKPNSRKQLELNTAPLLVLAEGVDWGDAAIQAYLAEQQVGSVQVDYRVPNREVSIPLAVRGTSQATAQNALQSVAAKVATIQREGGGWLKREWGSGRKVYLDVLNASLHTPDKYSHFGFETDMLLKLEAVPEFYGDEVALSDHAETSLPELTFTETIPGDYPARTRLVIDNDEASMVGRGLIASVGYYNSGASQVLPQSAFTLLDEATRELGGGGTGTTEANMIRHQELEETWTPVARYDGYHVGTFRLYGRLYSSQVTPGTNHMLVRAVWHVGDLASPVENEPALVTQWPLAGSPWQIHDLGEIRLQPGAAGRHRWSLQIEARWLAIAPNMPANPNILIDRFWLVSTDEGMSTYAAQDPGPPIGSLLAHSDFNQVSASAVTTQTMERGGNWAGAGDADDWTGNAPYIKRSATSDSAISLGRQLTAGTTNYVGVDVTGAFLFNTLPTVGNEGFHLGLIARWTGAAAFIMLAWEVLPTQRTLYLWEISAGPTESVLNYAVMNEVTANAFWGLRFTADSDGRYTVWAAQVDSNNWTPKAKVMEGQTNSMATGGARETGRVGVIDSAFLGIGERRCYAFSAGPHVPDAVAYGGRSVELGPDGAFRQDSSGQYNVKIPAQTGSVLRAPPSGPENRPIEFFVKMSSGRLRSSDVDLSTPDTSARVFYRPCWLQVAGQ